ncbi:hypothetical protein DRQ26_06420 [bacterium]|nr:MAG: hypothetical protein DRQ26_06420 [bacterium]
MKKKEPMTEDMDYNKFIELIDDMKSISTDTILLSGLGEPTLHKRINDMIDYAAKSGIDIDINTNATFGSSFLRSIPKLKSLRINLSSTSPDSYSKIYGKDMFYNVLSNLSKINKIRERLGRPKVMIIFMINKYNFMEVEDIINIGNRFGVDFMELRFIQPNNFTDKITISKKAADRLRTTIKRIIKKNIIRFDSNINRISEIMDTPDFLEKKKILLEPFYYRIPESKKKFRCYMGWYKTFIDVHGNVYPCSGNEAFLLGNIYKNRFSDIWKSEEYKRFRMESRSIDVRKKEFYRCRICAYMNQNIRIKKDIERLRKRFLVGEGPDASGYEKV